MKNIKILGLALMASIIATPVFAGETNIFSRANLHLSAIKNPIINEKHNAYAAKFSIGETANGENEAYAISPQDMNIHASESNLRGEYTESNLTTLGGAIDGALKSSSFPYEAYSGVR